MIARWLDRDALAVYLSVRVDELPRMQRAGRIPTPSFHLGPRSPRWDRLAIDSLFMGAPSSTPDIDAMVRGYVTAGRMENGKKASQRRHG